MNNMLPKENSLINDILRSSTQDQQELEMGNNSTSNNYSFIRNAIAQDSDSKAYLPGSIEAKDKEQLEDGSQSPSKLTNMDGRSKMGSWTANGDDLYH